LFEREGGNDTEQAKQKKVRVVIQQTVRHVERGKKHNHDSGPTSRSSWYHPNSHLLRMMAAHTEETLVSHNHFAMHRRNMTGREFKVIKNKQKDEESTVLRDENQTKEKGGGCLAVNFVCLSPGRT
jgi:hypothetical protein